MAFYEIELDPDADLVQMCADCGQTFGASHLGTCRYSLMNGGTTGIVGYRRKPDKEEDASG